MIILPYKHQRAANKFLTALLSMAIFTIAVPSYSSASDIDCTDSVGDDRVTAEFCTQQDLDAQAKTMTNVYKSLQRILSKEDRDTLEATQAQWLAYRTGHCRLFVQVAGNENPAWQMTWSGIATNACEADLTKDRVAQLKGLENIANLQAQQTNALRPPR